MGVAALLCLSLPLFSVVVPVYLLYACAHFDSSSVFESKRNMHGRNASEPFWILLHVSISSLVEWTRETEKVLYQGESCPFPGWRKRMKKEEQREGERELVQMNNLYRIPGIVCQGDDGRPVSKPKQTDYENTHTLSQGRLRGYWRL